MNLIEAIKQNNQAEVSRLLALKTDHLGKRFVDEVDEQRKGSPLYWAVSLGHVHFITPLIKAGTDVNKQDKFGNTPVYLAAGYGHAEAIRALHTAGANVNTPTKGDYTPVYAAAANGHIDAIRALLAAGANVNMSTNDVSPLCAAALGGHTAVVETLLEAGADASIKTKWGTVLDQAKQAKQGKAPRYPEVVRLLETHLKQYPSGIKPVLSKAVDEVKTAADVSAKQETKEATDVPATTDLEKLENLKKSIALGKKILIDQAELCYDILNRIGGLILLREGDTFVLCSGTGIKLGEKSIEELNKVIKLVQLNDGLPPAYADDRQPQTFSSLSLQENRPQVVSPTVATIPKPNLSEQSNQFAMLTQFQEVAKLALKVNVNDSKELQEFLRLVAEGEQDKAEVMLKSDSALALLSGDVTDLSKRTFTNITGFQYAVWALDWHMWTMIRKYLPPEEAQRQAQGFETGSWVRQHGVHANLNILIQAYQTSIDLYNAKKYTESNTAWVQQVGGAQFLLPAHVINEYCHPTRPFYPLPNFKEAVALPRSRALGEGDWFTAEYAGGKLGEKFACYRVGGLGAGTGGGVHYMGGHGKLDHESVRVLTSTRTAQREELVNELKPRSVQKQAA